MASHALANQAAPRVVIQEMLEQEIYDLLVYPAQVVPNSLGVVLAESPGVVDRLDVRLGDKVVKNQVVGQIRQLDPVYRYRPVEIRTMMSGIVSDLYITKGTQVNLGERLFLVTNPNDVKINMEVATRDIEALNTGLEGVFSVRGALEPTSVVIRGVSPMINPATGTATAELELSVERELPLGAIGRVEMRSNKKLGFMILQDAIFYRGEKAFVRVVKDDLTIESRPVKIGRKREGNVEILEGIALGDLVVLRSSGFLRDGHKVEVTNLPQDR